MGAAGTRQRIVAAHAYNPQLLASGTRMNRVRDGRVQTYKHPGDVIIDSLGVKHEVKDYGWY